ncbi:hypothetical protein SCB49_08768 [unidentified eubacterium SCB49]|nr:hypothetical protein SCB49_08768 [unidentified eubacterium SCB49]
MRNKYETVPKNEKKTPVMSVKNTAIYKAVKPAKL